MLECFQIIQQEVAKSGRTAKDLVLAKPDSFARITPSTFDALTEDDFSGRKKKAYLPAIILPVDKIMYVDTTHQLAAMYKLFQSLSDTAEKLALPSGEQANDSSTGYKQPDEHDDPLSMIALDLQWNDGEPMSLIQIAISDGRVFVIDIQHRTVLYMSMVYHILKFVFDREQSKKLLYGYKDNILRFNAVFQSFGEFWFTNVIDVSARRIERRQVHLNSLERQEKEVGSPLFSLQKQRDAENLEDVIQAFQEFEATGAPSSGSHPHSSPSYKQKDGENGDEDKVHSFDEDVTVNAPRVVQEVVMHGGGWSREQAAFEALQIRMDTRLGRSNWCFRPLSQAQVHHAAFDCLVRFTPSQFCHKKTNRFNIFSQFEIFRIKGVDIDRDSVQAEEYIPTPVVPSRPQGYHPGPETTFTEFERRAGKI